MNRLLNAVVMGPLKRLWIACRGGAVAVPPVPGFLPEKMALSVAGDVVALMLPLPTGIVLVRMTAEESRGFAWAAWEAARIAERARKAVTS